MGRFILRTLLFLALYVLLVSLLRGWMPVYLGSRHLLEKEKLLARADRPVDVLFIGSSRVYRSVVPELFDSLRRAELRRSFNLGAPAMSLNESLVLSESLVGSLRADHTLTHLVLEAQELRPVEPYRMSAPAETYWRTLPELLWTFQVACESRTLPSLGTLLFGHTASTLYGLFGVGHGQAYLDFLRPHHGDDGVIGARTDGYRSLEDERASLDIAEVRTGLDLRRQELLDHPEELQKRRAKSIHDLDTTLGPAPAALDRRIASLDRLCKARGIELLLVLPPRGVSTGSSTMLHLLPPERRVPLGDPREFPRFYDLDLSFDAGHLNEPGARAFTRALAEAWKDLDRRPASAAQGPGP